MIEFTGNQRTDSKCGVLAFRNQSVVAESPSSFRIVDEFSSGPISAAHTTFILRKVDPGHIELVMEIRRCEVPALQIGSTAAQA